MLRSALLDLMGRFGRFTRDRSGVAAVEFALILPFMLTLYIGTLELSQIIIVDRRVSTIAGTVGDLVARSDGTISTATINDYFQASEAIIAPFSTSGLKQVVTLLSIKSNGDAKVVWSVGYNGGTARAVNANYPLSKTSEINKVARGSYLVVAETSYSYTPLLAIVFQNTVNYSRENYYVPRYGEVIAKTN